MERLSIGGGPSCLWRGPIIYKKILAVYLGQTVYKGGQGRPNCKKTSQLSIRKAQLFVKKAQLSLGRVAVYGRA
jgi:hypothetical protein